MKTGDDCPLCGRGEAHSHIISNALPEGEHSTYEELLAEVKRYEDTPPTFAELSNLQDENDSLSMYNNELTRSIRAILRCATNATPAELGAALGLIRIECRRILGHPGCENVEMLMSASVDEILNEVKSSLTKMGPCCPPGTCKDGFEDSLECQRWRLTPSESG